MSIVGREPEAKLFTELYQSKKSEFLAVYGRRRVGKTFLIRNFFEKQDYYFEITGLKDGSLRDQLKNFNEAFSNCFYPELALAAPTNWHDAFTLLSKECDKISNKKVILFFDELPWLATKRSKILQNLDYFWNTNWSKRKNILLIVCGSAASWMLKNIIYAKGGLHNRITKSLLLKPFTLEQTKEYLCSKKIKLSHKQIVELYMVMGGIPFYLDTMRRGLSPTQIINEVCFSENGLLLHEFPNLFRSLFDAAEFNMTIIRTIAKKRYGISRSELLKNLKQKSGSVIQDRLEELIAAGFIQKFIPLDKKNKDHYFRIIDEYSLFYLHWIEKIAIQKTFLASQGYWQKLSKTSGWQSWAGYAFEEICLKHLNQIAKALKLDQVLWNAGCWRKQGEAEAAQIDLLFDRADGVITLCEIKYSDHPFILDKAYAKNLANKISVFEKNFKPSLAKTINLVLISTFGMKPSIWAESLVDHEVTMEDLFVA